MPPAKSPVTQQLQSLITDIIPAHFSHLTVPLFPPHITLTSEIPAEAYGEQAQQWLDQHIPNTPSAALPIVFETLDTEQPFFRKLTIRVEKTPLLAELAQNCRAFGVGLGKDAAQKWVEDEYRPHCSLM